MGRILLQQVMGNIPHSYQHSVDVKNRTIEGWNGIYKWEIFTTSSNG